MDRARRWPMPPLTCQALSCGDSQTGRPAGQEYGSQGAWAAHGKEGWGD